MMQRKVSKEMYEVKVKKTFSAAHRLTNYEGECANLHGHTWEVEVTYRSENLDEHGMVADFFEIKPELEKVLNRFDHRNINEVEPFDKISPTSENIAKYIYDELLIKHQKVKVHSVRVSESSSASATFFGE